MRALRTILMGSALLLLLACSRESGESQSSPEQPGDDQAPAAAPADAGGSARSGEDLAAEEPSAEDVPVAEDFAEEAEAQITAETYRAELDRLAAEIEGDTEGSPPSE